MTIEEYESIKGITVPTADRTRVSAEIIHTQRILEGLLGFTLDSSLINTNQYMEVGKTTVDCPCPDTVDVDALDAADSVVFAYRMFDYNRKDTIISIDPCSAVHALKLVFNNITFKTFETDEYREHSEHGFIKYLEDCENCCFCKCEICRCVQIAVDATWLWATLPDDLDQVWAEMVTFYSDLKTNIKSETMGPHSYTKFNDTPPEKEDHNMAVIKKYEGANGSSRRILTV